MPASLRLCPHRRVSMDDQEHGRRHPSAPRRHPSAPRRRQPRVRLDPAPIDSSPPFLHLSATGEGEEGGPNRHLELHAVQVVEDSRSSCSSYVPALYESIPNRVTVCKTTTWTLVMLGLQFSFMNSVADLQRGKIADLADHFIFHEPEENPLEKSISLKLNDYISKYAHVKTVCR